MGKTEEWKDVKGYEGFYQVSSFGNVRSIDRICGTTPNGCDRLVKGRNLTPTDNGSGYSIVMLSVGHRRKNHYVHRLVADAFLDKQEEKDYVNHIDYNKKNNDVSNLEWCTQSENIAHSKPNMCVQHKSKSTNTGHKYIYLKKGRYRVIVKKARTDRIFSNLADAIKYRNEVCNEINYTI